MNDRGMDVGPLVAAPPQGAGLTPEQAVAWCRALTGADGQEVIEQVRAWLAAGLPADPPAELGSLVDDRLAPSTVAAWLAAGFDLPAVARLAGIPLEAALSWRAAGLSTEQIRAVVDADPALAPEELAAFDAEGIGWPDRVAWIGYGFDASQARRWRQVGLSATQARVWRSVGLGPGDAAQQLASGGEWTPRGLQAGWFARSTDPADRQYGVTDPPGTRGRAASEPRDRRHYMRWSP